jgi:pimeloyl-ACP methyl ester carboxylesterase
MMPGIPHRVPVPLEHRVDLGDRGRCRVWEWPGPVGAPTVVLLHGVALDAETNWFPVCPTLGTQFRVITFDLRGHGQGGLPTTGTWRIEDCADDAAAVVHALATGPVIPVGYSMGGMVAQELWHRHPTLVAGLVLCATARNVAGTPGEMFLSMGMPWAIGAAKWVPLLSAIGSDSLAGPLLDASMDGPARAAALRHMRRTSLWVALEAMHAVSRFTSHRWIGTVDVPTGVLVTRHDRIVDPRRQGKLAASIPHSTVVEIAGDHGVFLADPTAFGHALLEVCSAAAQLPSTGSTSAA